MPRNQSMMPLSRRKIELRPSLLGSRSLFGSRSPFERLIRAIALVFITLVTTAFLGDAGRTAERPPVMGPNGGVSAGHPLTTAAAFEILARGGNAFDAGVAALLVAGVVEQDLFSLGGEALIL